MPSIAFSRPTPYLSATLTPALSRAMMDSHLFHRTTRLLVSARETYATVYVELHLAALKGPSAAHQTGSSQLVLKVGSLVAFGEVPRPTTSVLMWAETCGVVRILYPQIFRLLLVSCLIVCFFYFMSFCFHFFQAGIDDVYP